LCAAPRPGRGGQTELDRTGKGHARWAIRWKAALHAFAITFEGRIVPSTTN